MALFDPPSVGWSVLFRVSSVYVDAQWAYQGDGLQNCAVICIRNDFYVWSRGWELGHVDVEKS